MRAAVLTAPGTTPAWAEHPGPRRGPGTTLVAVTAAAIVPLDVLCASGTSYFGTPACPYVPGTQGVGVVEESATLAAGTRVFFETTAGRAPGDGSLAQRCAVPDAMVVPIEAGVADVEAAALGMSAVAAWRALTARGRFRAGERVVVLGGGGAVGQVAVGAARLLGAARVVAVCRSAGAGERAARAGADVVVPLAGDLAVGPAALAAALAEALGGEGADVVVDPVCGTAATAAARVLAPGGRLVNLGGASGDTAEFSSAVLRSRSAELLGYTNVTLTPAERRAALDAVFAAAADGALAVESEQLPMADVAAAWDRQAAGTASRRLVLTP
ncbi:zinc-binding dehydrogenase [Blastococcus sp. SYSU D00695]